MGEAGFLELAQKLAAGGFATFLVLILIGGKYKVWVFGHQLDAMAAEKDKAYEKMVQEKDAQIAYERSTHSEQLQALIEEKDALVAYERAEKVQWRDDFWDARRLTDKSVTLAQKVIGR